MYDVDVVDAVVMISVVVVCDVDVVMIVVYVECVVYNDSVEDDVDDDVVVVVVVVVIYVVKIAVVKEVDVLAANDEKARMNLRILQVANDDT